MEIIISQGDTADIIIPIKNKDDSPVVLNDLLGFSIFLYDENKKLIKKYSKNAITGYTNTLTIGEDENHVRLICESSHTRTMAGNIYYIFRAQSSNDDYENNRWSASTVNYVKLMRVIPAEGGQFTNV